MLFVVAVAEIVVHGVVVDPFMRLTLALAVPSHCLELLLPQILQPGRRFVRHVHLVGEEDARLGVEDGGRDVGVAGEVNCLRWPFQRDRVKIELRLVRVLDQNGAGLPELGNFDGELCSVLDLVCVHRRLLHPVLDDRLPASLTISGCCERSTS